MSTDLIPLIPDQTAIRTLPGRPPFMLDSDLGAFYGVLTERVNEQVRHNPDRFPEDFAFRLTDGETNLLRQNGGTSGALIPQNAGSSELSSHGGRRKLPMAFTEAGALALTGVLKTPRAAQVSVLVFRAFVELRQAADRRQAGDLVHIRAAAERMRAHLLSDRPYWNKIARLWDLGLSVYEIARLLRRPMAEVEVHHHEMKLCGAVASKLGLDGPWADCTGQLDGHPQESH